MHIQPGGYSFSLFDIWISFKDPKLDQPKS